MNVSQSIKERNTFVVSLHFNRVEYSKICLYSYFQKVKTPHTLVLWDNGSKDGTAEFLHDLQHNTKLLDSLPFEVEFHFSLSNVPWSDTINTLWSEGVARGYKYLGYCPSDMLICDDWIEYQENVMYADLHEKIAVISDALLDHERQQPQQPFEKISIKSLNLVTKDRFGDVPTDCKPSLTRSSLFKKYGPMKELGGMGAMIFYHGLLRNHGYLTACIPVESRSTELIMYDPILSFESTQKYHIYRKWLHRLKRNQLDGKTPPPDMYKGLAYAEV